MVLRALPLSQRRRNLRNRRRAPVSRIVRDLVARIGTAGLGGAPSAPEAGTGASGKCVCPLERLVARQIRRASRLPGCRRPGGPSTPGWRPPGCLDGQDRAGHGGGPLGRAGGVGDDGARVGPLLDQVDGGVASFTGDGAYDRADMYDAVATRHPKAEVIVPPRAGAVPSEAAETAPTQRDRHLRSIAEHGRPGWRKASGYNCRALAEAAMSRYKRVIGDALRSRTNRRQTVEVAVAVRALNRMLEFGRPEPVRVA